MPITWIVLQITELFGLGYLVRNLIWALLTYLCRNWKLFFKKHSIYLHLCTFFKIQEYFHGVVQISRSEEFLWVARTHLVDILTSRGAFPPCVAITTSCVAFSPCVAISTLHEHFSSHMAISTSCGAFSPCVAISTSCEHSHLAWGNFTLHSPFPPCVEHFHLT